MVGVVLSVLEDAGVEVVVIPFMAPNCNAHAERFVLSIKSECLERMIFFGRRRFRRAVETYIEHFNAERHHQGIDGVPAAADSYRPFGHVGCRERLGGLLKHYYRAAA